MNSAAKAIVARDPLISASMVRFLLMAGTRGSTFLAGFRERRHGEVLLVRSGASRTLIARQAHVHGGDGWLVSDARHGMLKLRYRTKRYDYDEDAPIFDSSDFKVETELQIPNSPLPETIIADLAGRRLGELVDYSGVPSFFASKATRIVRGEMIDHAGPYTLSLILDVKWYRMSHVLQRLG